METDEIRALIEAVLPDCRILVDGEGCNFSITVVSPAFGELSTVRRHQRVLGALQQPLASGALHAISIKAYTPTEWEQRRQEATATSASPDE